MKHRLLLALAGILLSSFSHADETITRTLAVTNQKNIQVYSTTDLPEGTARNLGPIVFHRTDDKSPSSQAMTNSIGQALNGPVFRTVPSIWWDKVFDGEGKGLGDTGVSSQVIFQGDWNSFLEKNRANAEKDGKELDGRGVMTAAVQTLMLGVSLLAGAPVTAVASAGLTGTYGSFTKEDARWFQSIQLNPDVLKNPPQNVLVTKSCMNRRGQDMTCVQTLALINSGNLDQARMVVANNVAEAFTKLIKPEPGLTPELEEKARHLNELLAAVNSTAKAN